VINMSRVVLGGLAAGLVINASEYVLNEIVLAEDMQAAITRMNLPPIGGPTIAVFMLFGFILGITTVWLYAAIRPRFGAGPTTALCAGSTVWLLAYLYPSVGYWVMGMMPAGAIVTAVVWGLVELLAAALVGGYLYQEGR
jgi:hypothetical protein